MSEPQVRKINRSNGEEELVPASSAVEILAGYYDLSKHQIRDALLNRVPMMTSGYVYTTTTCDARLYRMAADVSDAAAGDWQAAERFKRRIGEAR